MPPKPAAMCSTRRPVTPCGLRVCIAAGAKAQRIDKPNELFDDLVGKGE
jgi:hypothetical protein